MKTIKRYTIGSDDDDLTADVIERLPTVQTDNLDLLDSVRGYEAHFHDGIDTEQLIQFDDPEFYGVATELGYCTYGSHNASGEFNEIVYLVKE